MFHRWGSVKILFFLTYSLKGVLQFIDSAFYLRKGNRGSDAAAQEYGRA